MNHYDETVTRMRLANPATTADPDEMAVLRSIIDESMAAHPTPTDTHRIAAKSSATGRYRRPAAMAAAALLVLVLAIPVVYLGGRAADMADDAADTARPPSTVATEEPAPTVMDPITGRVAGQTVEVRVTGVTDHVGHELAGVLYAGGELLDLDADPLGGFWAVIDSEDFSVTEVVRTPASDYVGRFPYVTNTAFTVEPGTYTFVVWVDHGLSGIERRVPVNSDGQGLHGCHLTFDVGTDQQTAITVPANLQPDGWNVDCVTGAVTPGTDAAAAVAPAE